MSSSDPDTRRRILHRLRRARGQLDAVVTAVESEASCRDVLTQLAAVTHALNRAGFVIVANAMEECVSEPDPAKNRQGLTTEELEKLFLTLA